MPTSDQMARREVQNLWPLMINRGSRRSAGCARARSEPRRADENWPKIPRRAALVGRASRSTPRGVCYQGLDAHGQADLEHAESTQEIVFSWL